MKRPFVVLASGLLGIVLATPALAHEAGQWILRGGVGTVMPKDDNLRLPEIVIDPLTSVPTARAAMALIRPRFCTAISGFPRSMKAAALSANCRIAIRGWFSSWATPVAISPSVAILLA